MSRLFSLLHLLRFQQWPKNLIILIPIILSKKIGTASIAFDSLCAVILFSLLASSVYIMNDVVDIDRDKLHPEKKNRALPSGLFSKSFAVIISLILAICSVWLIFLINRYAALLALGYIALNILYTFWLKNIFLLDIIVISGNYLLRFLVGVAIASVLPSKWLLMCGIFLALFFVIGKRRQEISSMSSNPGHHKALLALYTIPFLDELITISATSLLILYILYTFDEHTTRLLEAPWLPVTIPFAIYAVFKYLYITRSTRARIDPIENILHHKDMLIALALWIITIIFLIYNPL